MTSATFSRHSLCSGGNRDLLHLLAGLAAHHAKNYCYPSLNTIQRLYGQLYGRSISPRTLCRHLKRLDAQGFITRQRRHTHDTHGMLLLRSTLYRITTWGTQALKKTYNRLRQALETLAVPFLAQYLTPMSDHPPPESERAPGKPGGARPSLPVPVETPVDKSVGREALEQMRRRLAGRTGPRRR